MPIGENKGDWQQFLQRVLAVNFSIKRANGATQNKMEMIEFVQGSNPVERIIAENSVETIESIGGSALAAVTSVITLKEQTDKFRNTKIFSLQPSGRWLCVYWQVTKIQ
jgi:hypothetical protein